MAFFGVVLVATEASHLVRYFTRFTEEGFCALISLIFIYDSLKKMLSLADAFPINWHYRLDNVTSYSCTCNLSSPGEPKQPWVGGSRRLLPQDLTGNVFPGWMWGGTAGGGCLIPSSPACPHCTSLSTVCPSIPAPWNCPGCRQGSTGSKESLDLLFLQDGECQGLESGTWMGLLCYF